MTLACNGNVREPAVIESVSITCPLHEWTDCWHVMAAVSSKLGGGRGNKVSAIIPGMSVPPPHGEGCCLDSNTGLQHWLHVYTGENTPSCPQHWTPTLAGYIREAAVLCKTLSCRHRVRLHGGGDDDLPVHLPVPHAASGRAPRPSPPPQAPRCTATRRVARRGVLPWASSPPCASAAHARLSHSPARAPSRPPGLPPRPPGLPPVAAGDAAVP